MRLGEEVLNHQNDSTASWVSREWAPQRETQTCSASKNQTLTHDLEWYIQARLVSLCKAGMSSHGGVCQDCHFHPGRGAIHPLTSASLLLCPHLPHSISHNGRLCYSHCL